MGSDLGKHSQTELTPEQVFELGCRADVPEAQALVLSCTGMRAVEAMDRLAVALEKPVSTHIQALMRAATVRLGIDPVQDRPTSRMQPAPGAPSQ